jgi:hypothetical protein
VLRLAVLTVLPAIYLDHEPAHEADEVEIVAVERMLAAKWITERPQTLQARPQHDLGFAHVATVLAGAGDLRAHRRSVHDTFQSSSVVRFA